MCSTISNALQQKSVQTQFPTNFHQSVPVTAYHSDQTVTNFPYFTLHLLQSNNNGHRTPGALNRNIITDSNFQLWAVCFSDVCVINNWTLPFPFRLGAKTQSNRIWSVVGVHSTICGTNWITPHNATHATWVSGIRFALLFASHVGVHVWLNCV